MASTIPNNEDLIIPPNMSREYLEKIFNTFMKDDAYDSQQFFKHFATRKAEVPLVMIDSLMDLTKNSICYDSQNKFDVRILLTLIHPKDKKLFIDVATQCMERFQGQPASVLTLTQYKAVLARRMAQVGF